MVTPATCGKPVPTAFNGPNPCLLKPGHVGICMGFACPNQHDFGDPALGSLCIACLADRITALEAKVHGVPVHRSTRERLRDLLHGLAVRLALLANRAAPPAVRGCSSCTAATHLGEKHMVGCGRPPGAP